MQQQAQWQSLLKQGTHSLQEIHQIEATHQRRMKSPFAEGRDKHSIHTIGGHSQLAHGQIGVGLKAAAPTAFPQTIRQLPAPGIIHIHNRSRPLASQIGRSKQPGFGLEVGLHRAVEVEVVVGEVRERHAAEPDAVDLWV